MSRKPIDVWLKFDAELIGSLGLDEDLATHEANTYRDGDEFVVEWYLNSVGLVTSVYFHTYEEAKEWYKREGFEDFTVDDGDGAYDTLTYVTQWECKNCAIDYHEDEKVTDPPICPAECEEPMTSPKRVAAGYL